MYLRGLVFQQKGMCVSPRLLTETVDRALKHHHAHVSYSKFLYNITGL